MQCLKRCLKPSDPIFVGSENRTAEVAICINSCAFNYVKYRMDVKNMFMATMDEVERNNDRIWNSYLQNEPKEENQS